MAMPILPKFLTLKWNILRTIWRIEVGDSSFFCIFHALPFELNFYFDRRFPLRMGNLQCLLYRNVADDVLFQKHFTDLDYLDWFSRYELFFEPRYL